MLVEGGPDLEELACRSRYCVPSTGYVGEVSKGVPHAHCPRPPLHLGRALRHPGELPLRLLHTRRPRRRGLGLLVARSVAAIVTAAVLGLVAGMAPQVAQQWERAVVLRLGRFDRPARPGLVLADSRSSTASRRGSISARSRRPFAAEQTLTSDTVPVNVDAVLFWMVHDAAEGRARGAGLPAGGELGGADRAARHHRPHVARRSAARARADRDRAAGADRQRAACRGA